MTCHTLGAGEKQPRTAHYERQDFPFMPKRLSKEEAEKADKTKLIRAEYEHEYIDL